MKRGFRPHRLSNRPANAAGYTIIEAMVVLAVTALMFSMAVGLIQGQQARTQFNQAIRDFESVVRDVIDDTATGFFPGNANFTCRIVPGAPLDRAVRITAPDRQQGTNTGCIFLGKVMQFGARRSGCTGTTDNNECNSMNVFSLAGRARIDKAEVTNLREADPTVVNDLTVPLTTRHALRVTRVFSDVPGQPTDDFGAIAFLTTLGKYNGTTDLLSGAQTVNALVVPGTVIGQTRTGSGSAAEQINNLDDLDAPATEQLSNPSGGIVICLQGGNNQRAAVVIGANNRKLTTETLVDGGVDDRYPGVCPS